MSVSMSIAEFIRRGEWQQMIQAAAAVLTVVVALLTLV
jgi:hypothetical protein